MHVCCAIEGACSACAPKQDVPHLGKRHKRSQTVLDGSPPKPLQPPSQPSTPLRRSLWGRGAAAAPEPQEPAGPNPYTACDPFDITMMRCATLLLLSPLTSP